MSKPRKKPNCVMRCKFTEQELSQISLHRFPKDPALLKAWIGCANLENRETLTTGMCSKHFRPGLIDKFMNRPYLRPQAIPTIFDHGNKRKIRKILREYSKEFSIYQKPIQKTTNVAMSMGSTPRSHLTSISTKDQHSTLGAATTTATTTTNVKKPGVTVWYSPPEPSKQPYLNTDIAPSILSNNQLPENINSSEENLESRKNKAVSLPIYSDTDSIDSLEYLRFSGSPTEPIEEVIVKEFTDYSCQSRGIVEQDPLTNKPEPAPLGISKTAIQQILVFPITESSPSKFLSNNQTIQNITPSQNNNEVHGISKKSTVFSHQTSSQPEDPIIDLTKEEEKKAEHFEMLNTRIDDIQNEIKTMQRSAKTITQSNSRYKKRIEGLQDKLNTQKDQIVILQKRFSDVLKETYFQMPLGITDWEWDIDYEHDLAEFNKQFIDDDDDNKDKNNPNTDHIYCIQTDDSKDDTCEEDDDDENYLMPIR